MLMIALSHVVNYVEISGNMVISTTESCQSGFGGRHRCHRRRRRHRHRRRQTA